MKNLMNWICLSACAAVLVNAAFAAEDTSGLPDQKAKISYAVGMNIGSNLKRGGYDVDVDVLAGAIKDALSGKQAKLTEQEARDIMSAAQKDLAAKREEERKVMAEKNAKAGEEFLAENKKKEGVKVLPVTLPDGKTVEMQYKVITEGSGAAPKTNDMVTVNYRGTLIDGKEFDSSAKRGQPAKFQVTRVIRGWTEALQLMKPGAKWELFIPAPLAYQDRAYGAMIEPGSTLVFEVELVSAEAPAPPPAATPSQPLTSDIIRVPSAEEMKKGAKIEVLKPEEAEKRAKEEAEKKK